MALTIALIINDATALTITLSDHSTIRPNRTPISWPGNGTNQVMQVHIPTSPAVASWLEYFQADTGILLTHPTLDELLMDRMAGCDCFHSRFDRKPSDKWHLREVCYCHVTQCDGSQVPLMTRSWHWPLQLTLSSCWDHDHDGQADSLQLLCPLSVWQWRIFFPRLLNKPSKPVANLCICLRPFVFVLFSLPCCLVEQWCWGRPS